MQLPFPGALAGLSFLLHGTYGSDRLPSLGDNDRATFRAHFIEQREAFRLELRRCNYLARHESSIAPTGHLTSWLEFDGTVITRHLQVADAFVRAFVYHRPFPVAGAGLTQKFLIVEGRFARDVNVQRWHMDSPGDRVLSPFRQRFQREVAVPQVMSLSGGIHESTRRVRVD